MIELLVVVAILGILAALLFPVVGGMRTKSDRTKCASNLRQIGVALQTYAGENNGELPPAIDSRRPSPGQVWFNAILPYLSPDAFNPKVSGNIICPEWLKIYKTDPAYANRPASDWDRSGYGMSYVTIGSPSTGWKERQGIPGPEYVVRTVALKEVTQTIVVTDSDSWNWGVHFLNYENGQHFNPANGRKKGLRHGEGANYLFGDGHVEFLTKETIVPFLAK